MATTKTIEQLDQATSVAVTDYVPVAQTVGEEAHKATVTQLANTIGNALTDGPLSELEYATAQGKNAIATALTAKGVTTTASETLIQMADKVNNLNIDDSVEDVSGYVITSTQSPVSKTDHWTSKIGDFHMCILLSSEMHIVPRQSSTINSIDELMSSASTYTYTFSNTPTCVVASSTGRYVAVYVSAESKVYVFNFNTTSGELIELKEYSVTATPYYATTYSQWFMDDGVTWISTPSGSSGFFYLCDVSAETTTRVSISGSGPYYYWQAVTWDNKIFWAGNEYTYYQIFTVTHTPGTTAYTATYTQKNFPSSINGFPAGGATYINSSNSIFIFGRGNTAQQFSVSVLTPYTSIWIGMYDTATDTISDYKLVPLHSTGEGLTGQWLKRNYASYLSWSRSDSNVIVGVGSPYIEYESPVIKLYGGLFFYGIEYNTETKTFTIPEDINEYFYSEWAADTTSSLRIYFPFNDVIFKNTTTNILYGVSDQKGYGTYVGLLRDARWVAVGKMPPSKYLIKRLITRNDEVYPVNYPYAETYGVSAAMIPVKTTITPAVPDTGDDDDSGGGAVTL